MSESEGSVQVVGTAHVSAESVREVEETIEEERPDVVAVELDEGRYNQMRGEEPEDLAAGDLLEGNTVFQFLAYWMLSYVQARMGDRFDIQPGAEMLAAVETAEDLDIELSLVDRDIQETIRRFWARMSLFEKLRVVGSLAFGITDPRIGGVVFGLLVGIVLGPILGVFGGAVGVTQSLLVGLTGSAFVGLGAAYVLSELTLRTIEDDVLALGGAAVAATVVGALAGVGLGLTDPLVTQYLGDFVITAVGSMTLGLSAGLVVGAVVAAVMGLLVDGGEPADEEMEELFDPDELTDTDVVTAMMEEFREFSPGGAEALIDERDAYIAHHLVDLREQGKEVVAIVGAGHQQGIESYLERPETLPPRESLTGQKERLLPWGKIVAVGITGAFVAFFVLLAMAGVEDRFLLELFGAWFVVNGVFAAGLARLAGARWPSALVGGSVAWLTSVNPLLAPGWFAGYVELRYTTVNVGDIDTLNQLIDDQETPILELVEEMFEVPLFKLIMIVALTNVGSFVASFLFALYVLPAFFGDIGGVAAVPELLIEGARNSARTLVGWVA
ncbi:TraB/GumN family protein [Halolamina sp. CBA1230]|uniref:TraB/GumN family protein n=1 Tax=Halolamina sp. CBA1230 TaxID=1853690 RepID=UPI0009A25819|nr:TraB/GumN family protein [Halolamina sp. CBA1230]QKY19562.1 TraB/GumN family protein [Halolamina sp. CBA1230]